MEKTKKLLPRIALGAVVLLVVVLLLVRETGSAAHKACEAFFTAYAQTDGQGAGALLAGGGGDMQFGALTGAVARQTRVELGQMNETEEGSVTISARITTVDLQAVLNRIPATVDSAEAAARWLEEALAADDVEMKTFDVEIAMVQVEEQWKISMTPELADALMGGYYSMLSGIIQEGDA